MTRKRSAVSGGTATREQLERSLALRPSSGRPLNQKQREFNRLVAAVEKLRDRLDASKRRLDDALVFHAEHLRPRLERLVAARKDLVLALRPFHDDRRLRRRDREDLQTILAEQLDEVLRDGSELEADLRELFEELHGASMTELEQEEMEQAREVMEGMFAEMGVEVEAHSRTSSGGRRTKRQKREDERVQRQEELRKTTLGAIYRRLAKVLHPDLEPDLERRRGKVELMQEVTVAYAGHDLHTLLRLELEWIHREESDQARMTDEKLDAYTPVLRDQVADLAAAIDALPYSPRYHPLAQEAGPFGTGLLLDGKAEARRLDALVKSLVATVKRLESGDKRQVVRDAIRESRHEGRMPY